MKIDGQLIASQIKSDLKNKIGKLRQKKIIPQLAVILIGNDPSSKVYVRRKEIFGEEIGAKVTLYSSSDPPAGGASRSSRLRSNNKRDLINLVNKLNQDKNVHGIIIQRPVPIDITKEELDLLVIPQKDVDGFHPESPFTPPIASAVIKILDWIYSHPALNAGSKWIPGQARNDKQLFVNWLKKQKILVIGRGETAGKPIAETLQKMGVKIEIGHSKTTNLKKLCLTSDIIISCVGKRHILRHPKGSPQNVPPIVRHDMVTSNTILIGVGLHQEDGKLATDYNQDEIAEKVAFYTPVPGGVGPVNVACLFENLIISCGIFGGFPLVAG